MNDFLQQFLIESREFVTQASDGLLVLEKTPHDAATLDTVFRAFHTLKGGAGNDILQGINYPNQVSDYTVSYAHATGGVTVSLALQAPTLGLSTPQAVGGAFDTSLGAIVWFYGRVADYNTMAERERTTSIRLGEHYALKKLSADQADSLAKSAIAETAIESVMAQMADDIQSAGARTGARMEAPPPQAAAELEDFCRRAGAN